MPEVRAVHPKLQQCSLFHHHACFSFSKITATLQRRPERFADSTPTESDIQDLQIYHDGMDDPLSWSYASNQTAYGSAFFFYSHILFLSHCLSLSLAFLSRLFAFFSIHACLSSLLVACLLCPQTRLAAGSSVRMGTSLTSIKTSVA